jgi:hypothetical protein
MFSGFWLKIYILAISAYDALIRILVRVKSYNAALIFMDISSAGLSRIDE